ncbi:heme-binding protein [Actimicrobium antarcticum]|uniref:Heme-binding protein n=1 Tax=Actimicrobium antarcticum TaxID=1051899 RepID=A0ABP7TIY4_9BURK
MQYRNPIAALTVIGLALCTASSVSAAAAAPTPVPLSLLKQDNVSLALANALISATLAACHANGRSAVAVVVDRGGNLIAVQRDDNVGPHNTEAAQRKAFTALSTKTPTRLLAANAQANPESQNLNTVSSLLLIGGGVPLIAGKEVIGAIGVGGSGGAAHDEACAINAINQVFPQASSTN